MTGLLHGVVRLVALLLIAAGNWLVLTILLGLGFMISERVFGTMALPEALPNWSALAVVVVGVVSASPAGEWFARLFYPIRKPTRREAAVIRDILINNERVAAFRTIAAPVSSWL